jgi:phosphoglycerate dehydrogenase-like enzyme
VTFRLRLLGDDDPQRATRLREAGVTLVASDAEPIDAAFGWEPDVPGVLGLVRQHPSLPWVHMRWAGIPRALLDGLAPYPATVLTNGSGAHGPAMAETVLGMILAQYKGHTTLRAAQARAEWSPRPMKELRGRTAGVVGLGDLGGSIAQALSAFGVHVLGMRRVARPAAHVERVFGPNQLDELLPQLDILVLAAPLTSGTRQLIGAAELARLPRGAFLVNVARGELVDESALIEALASGQLAGAALDVFQTEPLPADSPLWRLPNVFVSPHCADNTPQSLERAMDIFLDNLDRFRRGAPLRNVVDRTLGYRQNGSDAPA